MSVSNFYVDLIRIGLTMYWIPQGLELMRLIWPMVNVLKGADGLLIPIFKYGLIYFQFQLENHE